MPSFILKAFRYSLRTSCRVQLCPRKAALIALRAGAAPLELWIIETTVTRSSLVSAIISSQPKRY
ncbi:uncharacterized protein EKO05_0002440 [Ascochyta rabiei]|uniref:uncharacterized protein n=1 Tax=Didymella rabiei TaxID=5454 RepID=UPI00220A887A|nr:uncharacterized protein EKO05_0002440 [Ascochyta rabiei]UPX11856.1 hypothetical protein EKO05_0002440 [Ascochyta rabiei]